MTKMWHSSSSVIFFKEMVMCLSLGYENKCRFIGYLGENIFYLLNADFLLMDIMVDGGETRNVHS